MTGGNAIECPAERFFGTVKHGTETLASCNGSATGKTVLRRAPRWSSAAGANHAPFLLLIDPMRLTRECLEYGLAVPGRDSRVVAVASLAEVAEGHPDLVLVFQRAAARESAIPDRVDQIRLRYGSVPIILVTDHEDPHLVAEAFRRRIRGYLPLSSSPAVMRAAIDLVLAGGTYVPELVLAAAPPQMTGRRATAVAGHFTNREIQVLARLREAKPKKAIARDLHISLSTVKVHVRSIMKKMHAQNRTQVALEKAGV